MNAQIIDGRSFQHSLAAPSLEIVASAGIQPRMSMLSVDSDDSALQFSRDMYSVAFTTHNIDYEDCQLPADVKLEELLEIVEERNNNSRIHGIVVLTPLPAHIPMKKVLRAIKPEKELEGLHPDHMVSLVTSADGSPACFPIVGEAILRTLEKHDIVMKDKSVVIVMEEAHMRRNPVANLAARCAAPVMLPASSPISFVSVEHAEAPRIASEADILIVIAEQFGAVTAEWIKPGASVIDFNPSLVGFRESEDGQAQPVLSGTVAVEEVEGVADKVIIVQGGVRPITIGLLMRNLAMAAVSHHNIPVEQISALNRV